jgi:hypothetical protein
MFSRADLDVAFNYAYLVLISIVCSGFHSNRRMQRLVASTESLHYCIGRMSADGVYCLSRTCLPYVSAYIGGGVSGT